MQQYLIQHEALMQEWIEIAKIESKEISFVKDGIINPALWFSDSNTYKERILFLLKEAYSDDNQIWDEAKWLSHQKCSESCNRGFECLKCHVPGKTFNPMAEWIYGIESIACGNEKEYDAWFGLTNQNRTMAEYYQIRDTLLSRAAIMNLKKANGVNGSSNDDLYYYTARDKELLLRQIELIRPTVIICGGTYGMLRCLYTDLPAMENPFDGSCLFRGWKIIASYHPNSRQLTGKERYQNVMGSYKRINALCPHNHRTQILFSKGK